MISCRLRLDKGTETGKMTTIHAFLRNDHGDEMHPEDTIQHKACSSASSGHELQCTTNTCNED